MTKRLRGKLHGSDIPNFYHIFIYHSYVQYIYQYFALVWQHVIGLGAKLPKGPIVWQTNTRLYEYTYIVFKWKKFEKNLTPLTTPNSLFTIFLSRYQTKFSKRIDGHKNNNNMIYRMIHLVHTTAHFLSSFFFVFRDFVFAQFKM